MLYTESPYTFRQFWGSEGLNLAIFCSFEISGITLSEDIGEEWELTALHKLQIPTPSSLPFLDKTLPILSFFGDFRTSVQGRTLGIITQQLTSGWPTVAVMLPATVISHTLTVLLNYSQTWSVRERVGPHRASSTIALEYHCGALSFRFHTSIMTRPFRSLLGPLARHIPDTRVLEVCHNP